MALTIKTLPYPERHQRKCVVCQHEQHDEIDRRYVEWESIASVCNEFGVNERSLYRHVEALGLNEKKLANRRRLYFRMLENTPLDQMKPSDAIQVAKLLEQLEGKLIEKKSIEVGGISKIDREQLYEKVLARIDEMRARAPSEPNNEK